MIETTGYAERLPTGAWLPGALVTDHRGWTRPEEPYGKLARWATRPPVFAALVRADGKTTRARFESAREAFRWISGEVRQAVTRAGR